MPFCLSILLVVFVSQNSPFASANSLGTPSICDAYDSRIWAPEPGGTAMYWCSAPSENDDTVTLRTGDGDDPASDPTTYTPGELIYIHVRSVVQGEKYRGFLLNAVQQDQDGGAKRKVGAWELPQEGKKLFHTPPGACEEQTVMHAGADEKPYHNMFAFRAPKPGTGDITFECLLKFGPANTGHFRWPKRLVLKEGKAPDKEQVWFKGKPYKTCNQVCQSHGKQCSDSTLATITSAASFDQAIRRQYACKLPLLKGGCDQSYPGEETTEHFCYYPSAQCEAEGLCSEMSRTKARFCPCMAGSPPPPGRCAGRCKKNKAPWSTKCGWDTRACAACPECTGASLLVQGLDDWSEDMGESEDSWSELTASQAVGKATKSCERFTEKGQCEASGCFYQEEEGLNMCSQTKLPLQL